MRKARCCRASSKNGSPLEMLSGFLEEWTFLGWKFLGLRRRSRTCTARPTVQNVTLEQRGKLSRVRHSHSSFFFGTGVFLKMIPVPQFRFEYARRVVGLWG